MKTKDLVTIILLVIVVVAGIVALVIFKKEPAAPASNDLPELSDDTTKVINQDLESISEVNLDTEFEAVDKDINSL